MAFTINPLTNTIHIPKSDLTFVSGTLYTHDTDIFRLALKAWESSEEGITRTKTHDHNTQVTIVGVIYARAIKMLAPYSVEYENGAYSVVLQGSNSNIWDIAGGILVQNTVQVIPTNAAGLIVAETGTSGLTPAESDALLQNTTDLSTMTASVSVIEGDIALIQPDVAQLQVDVSSIDGNVTTMAVDISQIKSDIISIETDVGVLQIDVSAIEVDMAFIKAIEAGEWKIDSNQMIFYNTASAEIARFNLFDKVGSPTDEDVYRRVPV